MSVFTSATGAAAAAKSHASRRNRNELRQALELQELSYQTALAISSAPPPGTKVSRDDAMALAAMIKAWDLTANRVRILRGKPLPGSRRPGAEASKPNKRFRNLPPTLALLAQKAPTTAYSQHAPIS